MTLPPTSDNPMSYSEDLEPDDRPVHINPSLNFTIRTQKALRLTFGSNVKVPTAVGGTPALNGFAPQELIKVVFDPTLASPQYIPDSRLQYPFGLYKLQIRFVGDDNPLDTYKIGFWINYIDANGVFQ